MTPAFHPYPLPFRRIHSLPPYLLASKFCITFTGPTIHLLLSARVSSVWMAYAHLLSPTKLPICSDTITGSNSFMTVTLMFDPSPLLNLSLAPKHESLKSSTARSSSKWNLSLTPSTLNSSEWTHLWCTTTSSFVPTDSWLPSGTRDTTNRQPVRMDGNDKPPGENELLRKTCWQILEIRCRSE